VIVPLRRSRPFFVKKIINRIGLKTIDEAIAETDVRKHRCVGELQELVALEEMQASQATEAKAEFDQLGLEVAAKIEQEITAASELRDLRVHKGQLTSNTYALRMQLCEAQKKAALLEVLCVNRTKMKAYADEVQAAAKAADEINRQISEEKKLVKQSLEATRRAWAVMDTRGTKRTPRAAACEVDVDPDLSCSKRPRSDGKPIPSPMQSKSGLVCSACGTEEIAATILQSVSFSRLEAEAATQVEDAQPLGPY